MGQCKDCKWWDGEDVNFYSTERYHCRKAKQICSENYYSNKNLMVIAGSGDCAYLYTSPDFGCSEFEPK